MGILHDEPKYPVIDKAPSVGRTIANFSFSDYLQLAGYTAASVPFGYFAAGDIVKIRGPSMYTAATIGFFGGFFLAYQRSAGRLKGLLPNQDEVERFPA